VGGYFTFMDILTRIHGRTDPRLPATGGRTTPHATACILVPQAPRSYHLDSPPPCRLHHHHPHLPPWHLIFSAGEDFYRPRATCRPPFVNAAGMPRLEKAGNASCRTAPCMDSAVNTSDSLCLLEGAKDGPVEPS